MLEPKIQFKNTSVFFDNSSKKEIILENLNFEIYADEFVCILGPSGSGKTTVLGLVAGFIKPAVSPRIVVFPQPEGPKIQTNSSAKISKFKSCKMISFVDILLKD